MTALQEKKSEPSPSKGRVLVVDDDRGVCNVLVRTLRDAGCSVTEAHSGEEALGLVENLQAEAIVADIAMPQMNGLDLLCKLRDQGFTVPVLLITGRPDLETAKRAVKLGAFSYLPKPLDLDELQAEVVRALDWARKNASGVGSDGQERRAFAEALDLLSMHYQPVVRSDGRDVMGYEALLRVRTPTIAHVGELLQVAEKLQATIPLGRRVRSRCFADWTSTTPSGLLFINLHCQELLDEELFAANAPLAAIADSVVLELTERASFEAIPDVEERVCRLQSMGFRVALDDIGSGYSGLTLLSVLQPDIVKIDMALVRDVNASTKKQRLIRSILSICEDLEAQTIAEGVETKEELSTLVSLGCTLFQGYLFCRPAEPFPSITWPDD